MGLLDSLKNAVTGGAARVELVTEHLRLTIGSTCWVKITVTSTGGELRSEGVFVDLEATETVRWHDAEGKVVSHAERLVSKEIQIAPAFVLAPGESRQFKGELTVPPGSPPTYKGRNADHGWRIRGRVQAFGNDPDSGFRPIEVLAS